MKKVEIGFFCVLAINSTIFAANTRAVAQVIPDTTLGAESSTTRLDPQFPVDLIEGGATGGVNLFHSFSEFNVSEGRGAYFFSPSADIQNILARVTGGNPSTILETQIGQLPGGRTAVYAQINFAQSLKRLKNTSTATAKLLAKAVKLAQSLQDPRLEAYALGSLGELYEQNQQVTEAKRLTQQALLLGQSINAPDISYRLQWQLGRLLKAEGNITDAIASYTEAVNSLQSLRSDLVATNSNIEFSFRSSVEPVYRQLVSLLPESAQPSTEINSFTKSQKI